MTFLLYLKFYFVCLLVGHSPVKLQGYQKTWELMDEDFSVVAEIQICKRCHQLYADFPEVKNES